MVENKFFEMIEHDDNVLGMILRSSYQSEGITFFTPGTFSQQLAYMSHPQGHIIEPHVHNSVPRQVHFTQEVLFIKSGRVRVDFYCQAKVYVESRVLNKGDIILLASGGHGFELIEPSEIIEVKQGPYAGELDKVRFDPVSPDNVTFKRAR